MRLGLSTLVVVQTGWSMNNRAGVHHFQLRRLDGRWQIIRRICRTLDGDAEARRLLAAGVAGLNGGSR